MVFKELRTEHEMGDDDSRNWGGSRRTNTQLNINNYFAFQSLIAHNYFHFP